MLLLGLLAGISAATAPASPTAVRLQNRVTVRIVRGARVERGKSDEPHSRGVIRVADANGEGQTIPLVEFQ